MCNHRPAWIKSEPIDQQLPVISINWIVMLPRNVGRATGGVFEIWQQCEMMKQTAAERERESVYLIGYFPANYSINWISEKRTLLKILSNLICLIIWSQGAEWNLKYGNNANQWSKSRHHTSIICPVGSFPTNQRINRRFFNKNFVENIVKYYLIGCWIE